MKVLTLGVHLDTTGAVSVGWGVREESTGGGSTSEEG